MLSFPLPLLSFDHVGAEQLEWDDASEEITFAAPLGQRFRCAHDGLHRFEIFIEPTFHFKRCHLWLQVFSGDVTAGRSPTSPLPLRLAGPLAAESLVAHGWFSFEFDPIPESDGKTYTFILVSPDGTPGNALSVRTVRKLRGIGQVSTGNGPAGGALAFRALCLRAPALWENFQRFRRQSSEHPRQVDYHPLMVRLEVSRPCNLHCVMCQRGQHPFSAEREAPAFLSLNSLHALQPILPTLLRVIAFGLGEPFLNPHYLEILLTNNCGPNFRRGHCTPIAAPASGRTS